MSRLARIRCKVNASDPWNDATICPADPKKVECEILNMSSENTGRNQIAVMDNHVIRRGIRKVTLTFPSMNAVNTARLIRWTRSYGRDVNSTSRANVNNTLVWLRFTDPRTNEIVSARGYFGAQIKIGWVFVDDRHTHAEQGLILEWIEQ